MNISSYELAAKMFSVYENLLIDIESENIKAQKMEFLDKHNILREHHDELSRYGGSLTKEYLEKVETTMASFKNIYDNFEDKLLIFLVGDGNVGKSTLINALIGYEVAEMNFLPKTWKIDIFSPDLEKGRALVRYSNGEELLCSEEEVRSLILEEEEKVKESKKNANMLYKQRLTELRDRGPVTKKHHSELRQYIDKKYIYSSDIAEVLWSVENNNILEQCLVVDTPGLNQYLEGVKEKGNISNYYYKADGVIWILDGNVISSQSPSKLIEEIETSMGSLVGDRENIIGVINRMDLIKDKKDREKVILKAEEIFKDKFSRIVGLSALKAYEASLNKNQDLLEESGILELENEIKKIFINKSAELKSRSKIQMNKILIESVCKNFLDYRSNIEEFYMVYNYKLDKINEYKSILVQEIRTSLNDFLYNYQLQVEYRSEQLVYKLSEGHGESYVLEHIYRVDEFKKSLELIVDNINDRLKLSAYNWLEFSFISEYQYLETSDGVDVSINFNHIDFNFPDVKKIEYFFPQFGNNLLSSISNFFGSIMFKLRVGRIVNNLVAVISSKNQIIYETIMLNVHDNLNIVIEQSNKILERSYNNLLFPVEETSSILDSLETTEDILLKEKPDKIDLNNLIL